MVAHDDEPSAHLEGRDAVRQKRVEHLHFAVDRNAHRLKYACRKLGVSPPLAERLEDVAQLGGSGERKRAQNRSSHRRGAFHIAKLGQHLAQLEFADLIQPFARGLSGFGIHAHVERALVLVGETALGRIELVAADTKVGQDSVHLRRAVQL